ncbi:MAG: YhcH/YjgK/YiaL family protein [Paludibacter sp.]|jgi:YhcH/YjgK/YiaL family protein|nr:YhcH/YjgK/YiaL family protein [Paludibacter sp.]
MILDTLKNSDKYCSVHPRFKKAFDYLKNTDLVALPAGKIELEGADLVINVVDITAKPEADAKMESHKEYIDIQVPVGKAETMGWIALDACKDVTLPYDAEKDIMFFADKATSFLNVQPYEFVVFFPEDAHQPGIGTGQYRKIIVKVRV